MRLLILVLLVLPTYVVAKSDDEVTLTHLKEVLWPQAYKEQDADLLGEILDESFELVAADGKRSSKQQELSDLDKYPWPHEKFSFKVKRLDVYQQKFAVVSGEGKAQGRAGEADYCFTYQSSNVLHKVAGEWKAVLSHVSGVNKSCQLTE